MGKAINKQIIPSQAKNKSPTLNTKSVKYELFLNFFLSTILDFLRKYFKPQNINFSATN